MADELQLDVAGIKAQLVHIACAIEELKDALEPLKELGHAVTRLDERIQVIQRDQAALSSFRDATSDFVSRAKGGLAVALFLSTIINGVIGWGVSRLWESQTRLESEIKSLREQRDGENLPNRSPR